LSRMRDANNCMIDQATSKPIALLIPGLDGTGGLYYRQIQPLSAMYHVAVQAFSPLSDVTFEDLVEELAETVSDHANRPIVVVGESFGGTVAMHFVLAYPERVRALALINTFPYYRRRGRIHLGCRLLPLLQWAVLKRIRNSVVDHVLASEGIPLADRLKYQEIIRRVSLPAYRRRLELVRDVNLIGRLTEIQVPTYLFASGRDKLVPSIVEAHFMASRIPHAVLYEFPHAGHALLQTPGFSLADYL